jgi:aerobic-type carbon monoxide dehydrogenase small subunit (CoxS/CutS family)
MAQKNVTTIEGLAEQKREIEDLKTRMKRLEDAFAV